MANSLIGKTIVALKIASDKKALLFVTDGGNFLVRCYGDCCSSTWIEHIECPALGFPAKVLSIDDLDMPGLGQPNEYKVIEYYGCKIVTDKGDIVVDYRNKSNGYYGGSLVWPNDYCHFYDRINDRNVSTMDWVDVVCDI